MQLTHCILHQCMLQNSCNIKQATSCRSGHVAAVTQQRCRLHHALHNFVITQAEAHPRQGHGVAAHQDMLVTGHLTDQAVAFCIPLRMK